MEEYTIEALKWMVNLLNKHNIPYQISGGFAAKIYGSTRPLNDIDFDIPEDKFELLLPEISQNIIYGPAQYVDGKWDAYLMTINYKGQEIDICGSSKTKITSRDRKVWIPLKVNFSKNIKLLLFNTEVNLVHPSDLIEYKQHLDGDHQLEDIENSKQYIISSNI